MHRTRLHSRASLQAVLDIAAVIAITSLELAVEVLVPANRDGETPSVHTLVAAPPASARGVVEQRVCSAPTYLSLMKSMSLSTWATRAMRPFFLRACFLAILPHIPHTVTLPCRRKDAGQQRNVCRTLC